MKKILILALLLNALYICHAQNKKYTPTIEPYGCPFKADTSLKTRCGYLIVPENRQKPTGRTIKLPFIYVESNNPNKKKDPVLLSAGGPGSSSLGSVNGMTEKALGGRDFIAFEQRGTKYALPSLDCPEVNEAIKTAYRNGLSKDSLVLDAVKQCRKKFIAQGIDLSAYNTVESAADIEDLRLALKIDSLNLLGMSYSGGLMLTVLRNYPSGIRCAVLDSPLPGFVNYDEGGLFNINNALHQVFSKCKADSTDKVKYGNLEQQFQQYFTAIGNKAFVFSYTEQKTGKTFNIKYTRNELISVILSRLSSHSTIKQVPYIVTELINGNHQPYIKELMDNIFNGSGGMALGMRYSVWCTEQMPFEDEAIIKKQDQALPYLAGFQFNNVNKSICNCWDVKSIPAEAKRPFYSSKPVLLSAGDCDPWCSPLYTDLIHYYLPNSQRLLFSAKTHMPLFKREGKTFVQSFLDNPYQKLESNSPSIIVY